MEEDRAEVDLGIAADIEARIEETASEQQRQPKKRFVGRRQAAEAAAAKDGKGEVAEGDSGTVQSMYYPSCVDLFVRRPLADKVFPRSPTSTSTSVAQ
jgi:2-(3-amino-3-carboxypropyl)histidine synthase